MSMSAINLAAAEESTQVGNTWLNLAIFGGFVAITMVFVIRAGRDQQERLGHVHRRRRLHRAAERDRHLRRLPLGRIISRHRRGDRAGRIRRLPLQRRLPGRLVGGAAAGRRVPAQHRPVHHGRRAGVPHAGASGPDRRGDLDAGGFVLLSAGADGGRRWAGRVADEHHRPVRAEHRHRRGRRPDDRVRADRRDEGHDLRPDHQGDPADLRRRGDDLLGAGQLRDEFLRSAGRGRRGRRAVGAGRQVRPVEPHQDRFHLARPRAGARDGRPAAHPDAVLHRADGQGGPQVCGVGDRADRPVLPVHPGPRVTGRQPWSVPRPSRRRRAGPTRPLRCSPTSSAGPSCWGSSRRWRSRRSSLSWPG